MLKGKHVVTEIEGVRCTVVGSGISGERAAFLKDLLAYNGYEVKTEEEKAKDGSGTGAFILGVTDLLMNPVIKLFQKKFFRKDGNVVNVAYWNQWPDQWDIPYCQIQH